MVYSQYPIVEVDVPDLSLDVSNFRFPVDQPSESAAMNYLFAENGAMGLAELILRDGYIDNELPLVVVDRSRTVILEGNRRLSALRALLDPSLVPARQAELERLVRRFAVEAADLPSRVRVMQFPSRELAAPVLARLHIGEPKRAWGLDEQAKFVLAQLIEGISVAELREQLPAVKDVVRLVRMGRVRQMLSEANLGDPELEDFVSGDKLAMSSFEYAYRNAEVQALIGLKFSPDGALIARPTTSAELFALRRLLRGFLRNELNTRRGLKRGSEEFLRLLAEMGGVQNSHESAADENADNDGTGRADETGKHDDKQDGESDESSGAASKSNTDSTSETSTDGLGEAETAASGRRGPNDPASKRSLDFTGVDENSLPLPLKHRVRELRKIDVYSFPAASAMLMRSVLEAAIKEHYGLSSPREAKGTLGDVMVKVTADHGRNGQLSHSISTINNTRRGASTVPGTGEWFNLVAHSVNIDVAGVQVHAAWRVIFPLVRFLLTAK